MSFPHWLRALPALAFALPLSAAVPPTQPANPINTGGLWVGQSEPGTSCYAEKITLTTSFQDWRMVVRGTVNLAPATGGQAKIYADWISPRGEHLREVEYTDAEGVAHFSHSGAPGTWKLTILQVLKVRFRFDAARGQTEAAITPEDPQPAGGV